MILRFYDFDLNPLFAETDVISTSWTLYYNDIGLFEAHISLKSEAADSIMNNKFLLVSENKKCAVITGMQVSDELVLYGRTCNWFLKKRVAERGIKEGSIESVCQQLIVPAFHDVEGFSFECESGDTQITKSIDKMCELFTPINEILSENGLGHSFEFDAVQKVWLFKITHGQPRDLIISECYKNAYDAVITRDILDYATHGKYEQKIHRIFEGIVDTVVEAVNVGSENAQGLYRLETALEAESRSEAENMLSALTENNSVSMTLRGIKLGIDYNLGDTVKVRIKKGSLKMLLEKRINGVVIKHECGTMTEKPIFEDI